MKVAVIVLLTVLFGCACGIARAYAPFAIDISGPEGLRCFAIIDDGKTVSGGCIERK